MQRAQWGEMLIPREPGKGEQKPVRQLELPSLAAASQNVLTVHRKPIRGYAKLS